MAKRPQKTQKSRHTADKSRTKLRDLVVVTFAGDMDEARDYETLLKGNDIPAVVREQSIEESQDDKTIAVMVPEDYLDEAHVIIESQDAYDDFYDLAMEDEGEEEDTDGDVFDDNF
jgi:hypothetical protein